MHLKKKKHCWPIIQPYMSRVNQWTKARIIGAYSVSIEFLLSNVSAADLPALLRRAGIYDICVRKTSVCGHTCGVRRVFLHSESWLESVCHLSGSEHFHRCLQPTVSHSTVHVPLCSSKVWCQEDDLTVGRCHSPWRSGWSGWIWR